MSDKQAIALVFAPHGRDAEVADAILRGVGIAVHECTSVPALLESLPDGDCAIVAGEGLSRTDLAALAEWVEAQPPWSDFPFIVLSLRGGVASPELVARLGNASILERPFHPSVLIAAVQTAARARRRQKETEAHLSERELLIRELHHRVKNSLATVQALLRATIRGAKSLEDFQAVFSERLLSLSRTHGLLIEAGWHSASLHDILRSEVGLYDDRSGRIALRGPVLRLPPSLALSLGMVIHELATNAAKYGALSVPEGRLEVVWKSSTSRLSLVWDEQDGPEVFAPDEKGFGSTLIERLLMRQCGGTHATEFRPSGLRFELDLPLDAELAPGAQYRSDGQREEARAAA